MDDEDYHIYGPEPERQLTPEQQKELDEVRLIDEQIEQTGVIPF